MLVGLAIGLRVIARREIKGPARPRLPKRETEGIEHLDPAGQRVRVVAARRERPRAVPKNLLLRPPEEEDRGRVLPGHGERAGPRLLGFEPIEKGRSTEPRRRGSGTGHPE